MYFRNPLLLSRGNRRGDREPARIAVTQRTRECTTGVVQIAHYIVALWLYPVSHPRHEIVEGSGLLGRR